MNKDRIKQLLLEMITESMNIDYVYKILDKYPIYANSILELDTTKGKSYSAALAVFFIKALPPLNWNAEPSDEINARNAKVFEEIKSYFNRFLILKKNNKTVITLPDGTRTNFDLNNPRHTHDKNFEHFKEYVDNLEKKHGDSSMDVKKKTVSVDNNITIMGTTIDKNDITYPDVNDPDFDNKSKTVVIVRADDMIKSYHYGENYAYDPLAALKAIHGPDYNPEDDEDFDPDYAEELEPALWCVAEDPKEGSNLFYNYRFGRRQDQNTMQTLYYVYFPEKYAKNKNDPQSVLSLGLTRDRKLSYTDRTNKETTVPINYLKTQFKKEFKDVDLNKAFVFKELDENEKRVYNLPGEMNDDDFKKLNSYQRKVYIQTNARKINYTKWIMMDEVTQDLWLLMCEHNGTVADENYVIDGLTLASILKTTRGKRYVDSRRQRMGEMLNELGKSVSKEKFNECIDDIFKIIGDKLSYTAIDYMFSCLRNSEPYIQNAAALKVYEMHEGNTRHFGNRMYLDVIKNADYKLRSRIITDVLKELNSLETKMDISILRLLMSASASAFDMALMLIEKYDINYHISYYENPIKELLSEMDIEQTTIIINKLIDKIYSKTQTIPEDIMDCFFKESITEQSKKDLVKKFTELNLVEPKYIALYIRELNSLSGNYDCISYFSKYLDKFSNQDIQKMLRSSNHVSNYEMARFIIEIKKGQLDINLCNILLGTVEFSKYFPDILMYMIENNKPMVKDDAFFVFAMYDSIHKHSDHFKENKGSLKFKFKFCNKIINIKMESLTPDDMNNMFIMFDGNTKILRILKKRILTVKGQSLTLNDITKLVNMYNPDTEIAKEIIKLKGDDLDQHMVAVLLLREITPKERNDIADLLFNAIKNKINGSYLKLLGNAISKARYYSPTSGFVFTKKIIEEKYKELTFEELHEFMDRLVLEQKQYDELMVIMNARYGINEFLVKPKVKINNYKDFYVHIFE